ncbi:MAG: trypsin-like peptidase domain-containing protein [Planctomycetia bacterium]|jgi:serine protease Do
MRFYKPFYVRFYTHTLSAFILIALMLGLMLDTATAQQTPPGLPKDHFPQIHQPTKKPSFFLTGRSYLNPDEEKRLRERLIHEAEYFERQAAVMKTVARLIEPTVVHIEADVTNRRSLRQGGGGQIEESGSGVIIRYKNRYFVITNRHVVRDAPLHLIRIGLADRRSIHPTRIWSDRETDTAVMEIKARHLNHARLGDSRRMEVGDFVLAVGSPFGLSRSITFGIISAKNRRKLDLGNKDFTSQNFIQTDAAINPGNSGGPLVNLRGEVIGINTAIASSSGGSEGIAFAMPINVVFNIARQLIDTGKVSRAYLGVTLDRHFGPAAAAEVGLQVPIGTRVNGITPGTPADKAGLRINDVILKFNGVPIEDDDHLVTLVSLSPVNEEATLLIFRNYEEMQIKTKLTERPANLPTE